MDNSKRIRNEFTAFIKLAIQNKAINYKKKLLKTLEKEVSIESFEILPKELSCDDNSFLLEKGIKHSEIENLFTDEKYYKAMKKLSDRVSLFEAPRSRKLLKCTRTWDISPVLEIFKDIFDEKLILSVWQKVKNRYIENRNQIKDLLDDFERW